MTLKEQIDQQILYAGNFFEFCSNVLGYRDMLPEHKDLCQFVQTPGALKLVLMPRYSFKSCICTIGYTLWRLVRDDSARVLIYSDTSSKAENFLTSIKNHVFGLEKGSRFREVYGAWEVDPKRGVWNQSQILIKPRQSAHAEPSVDTGGIETSKVGMHYDLIVFDDIVSDANVTTPEQMQKVKECYRKALSLLKPGGEVLLTGTRWHFGDLYGQLVAEPPKELKTFIKRAMVDGSYPFSRIGLTREFCDQQKRNQGSYVFSALYQNDPTDDETAMFKVKDFSFYSLPVGDTRDTFLRSLYITCCIDPAISQAKDADETALSVVGTDKDMNLYCLDMVAGHFLPDEMVDQLFALHTKWGFRTVGLETNAFQKMLKRDIELRVTEERKRPTFQMFSLVEFTGTSSTSKELRIRGLQPYHERQALKIPGERLETLETNWSVLAFQMLQFPHCAHDDRLDSLAYHLQILRAGSVTVTPSHIPYRSAAWEVKQVEHEEELVMARRPRWQRRPSEPMVFV